MGKQTKFTPGPWWVAGKATIRSGSPNSIDTGWIGTLNWQNRDANARLIVVAPDMFAYVAARAAAGDAEAAALVAKATETEAA